MLRVPPSPPRSGFIEPCLPSTAERPPSGPEWVHEIKQYANAQFVMAITGNRLRIVQRLTAPTMMAAIMTKELLMSDNVKNHSSEELSEERLDRVSGGLNPQPLPPGGAELKALATNYRANFQVAF